MSTGIVTQRSRPNTDGVSQANPVAPPPVAAPPPATATAPATTTAPETRTPAADETVTQSRSRAAAQETAAAQRISGAYVPAPALDQVRAGTAQLRRGQQGESVLDTQRRLNANGANPRLVEDGKFGPKTQAAVHTYQESRGITDSGVVGRQTVNALDTSAPAVQRPAVTGTPSGPTTERSSGAGNVNTANMTEAQKYDHYKGLIEQNGGKFKSGPNERNVVSIRQETSTKANGGNGLYDDKTAMLWTDKQGNKHVTEYKSNTEPSARYEGRYGEDVNGDGRRDLGRLRTGYYEYQTGSSSTLGRVLRPTANATVERDTNHDGRFNDGARGSAGQSMLFHAGGNNMTGSAGCQTMSPGEYNRFWRDLNSGGNPGKIGYTLINA